MKISTYYLIIGFILLVGLVVLNRFFSNYIINLDILNFVMLLGAGFCFGYIFWVVWLNRGLKRKMKKQIDNSTEIDKTRIAKGQMKYVLKLMKIAKEEGYKQALTSEIKFLEYLHNDFEKNPDVLTWLRIDIRDRIKELKEQKQTRRNSNKMKEEYKDIGIIKGKPSEHTEIAMWNAGFKAGKLQARKEHEAQVPAIVDVTKQDCRKKFEKIINRLKYTYTHSGDEGTSCYVEAVRVDKLKEEIDKIQGDKT